MPRTRLQLVEIIEDADPCPRLSPWEREFLASLGRGMLMLGEAFKMTDRQFQVVEQIERKIYAT